MAIARSTALLQRPRSIVAPNVAWVEGSSGASHRLFTPLRRHCAHYSATPQPYTPLLPLPPPPNSLCSRLHQPLLPRQQAQTHVDARQPARAHMHGARGQRRRGASGGGRAAPAAAAPSAKQEPRAEMWGRFCATVRLVGQPQLPAQCALVLQHAAPLVGMRAGTVACCVRAAAVRAANTQLWNLTRSAICPARPVSLQRCSSRSRARTWPTWRPATGCGGWALRASLRSTASW